MAVDPVIQDFIARSMAEYNRSLMSEMSTLITNSVESIKRSNSEAVEDQLREIKKMRREEPKSFKRKGTEIQYKFNEKSLKSVAAKKKKKKKQGGFPSSPSVPQSSRVPFQQSSSFTSWCYRQPFFSRSIADLPSKPGSCFGCGKFGHWRA